MNSAQDDSWKGTPQSVFDNSKVKSDYISDPTDIGSNVPEKKNYTDNTTPVTHLTSVGTPNKKTQIDTVEK